MSLWDYLHLHPWFALLHGFALVFIIMASMHAVIGTVGVWFGTVKKLRELEEAFAWLKDSEYSTERIAAMMGAMSTAMKNDNTPKRQEDPDGEEAPTS